MSNVPKDNVTDDNIVKDNTVQDNLPKDNVLNPDDVERNTDLTNHGNDVGQIDRESPEIIRRGNRGQ